MTDVTLNTEKAIRATRNAAILRDYLANIPVNEVARLYAVSRATVTSLARAYNIQRNPRLIGKERGRVKRLLRNGHNLSEIERRTGMSRRSIARIKKDLAL